MSLWKNEVWHGERDTGLEAEQYWNIIECSDIISLISFKVNRLIKIKTFFCPSLEISSIWSNVLILIRKMRCVYLYYKWMDSKCGQWIYMQYTVPRGWNVNDITSIRSSCVVVRRTGEWNNWQQYVCNAGMETDSMVVSFSHCVCYRNSQSIRKRWVDCNVVERMIFQVHSVGFYTSHSLEWFLWSRRWIEFQVNLHKSCTLFVGFFSLVVVFV